jgi:hypothetical protein
VAFEQETKKNHGKGDSLPLADVEHLIDKALEEDDTDNDGMISWMEYIFSEKNHSK